MGIKLPAALNTFGGFINREAPTIMSVGAVIGVALTAYLTYRMRPKVDEVIDAAKEAKEEINKAAEEKRKEISKGSDKNKEEKLEEVEKEVKTKSKGVTVDTVIGVVKVVWPAVLIGVSTIVLIIGANRISVKRIAMYATAYEVASGDLKKTKEKMEEILGEQKAEEIKRAVTEDDIKEACDDNGHPKVIYNSGQGDQLYYDWWSGRFFRASEPAIERIFRRICQEVSVTMFASLNSTLYSDLNLPDIGAGEDFGFGVDNTDPTFESYWVETPGGDKAIVLKYTLKIRQKYGDF